MKVLVVGSVPPPATGDRQALLHEVLRLRREGHEVEIVSIDPLSASHRYLAAPGLAAALEVGLLARRADVLVLQIQAGLPVRAGAGRAERGAALMAMARALQGRDATVRLSRLEDLPGGLGGRAAVALWSAATRIEVGDESLRDVLVPLLGPIGDRVSVFSPEPKAAEPLGLASGGWGDGADVTAAEVTGIVRRKAAMEREALTGRLPDRPGGPAVRVSQWQWLPSPGLGVPDLGPLRGATPDEDRAGRGRLRSQSGERRSTPTRSLRAAVSGLLAAAERRPGTRSTAHVARLGWTELRRVMRRAT